MPRKSQSREKPERNDEQFRISLKESIKSLGIIGLDDEQLDQFLSWATKTGPSYTHLLEKVFGHVASLAKERRIERRIKASGLPERKTFERFDWGFQPKLNRAAIEELAMLEFINRNDDIIFTGKCGTGKSHLIKAIALKACCANYSVHYARCVDLVNTLYAGLADNSYEKRLKRYSRVDLLIIDDVGLGQVKKREDEPTAAHALYNLIDLRHQKHSTAVTSNIKLSAWGRYLGDTTLTAAILDRLAMTAIRIDIDGKSYRQHLAQNRSKKSPKE